MGVFVFEDCFLFFFPFFWEAGDESITVSIHQREKKKSLGKVLHITKHDLLKHKERQSCLLLLIRVQQWVKELNDRRILTGPHSRLCHWIWSTDCVFFSSNELYSMCVMCQELICMLDEMVNCSQCIFPRSPGSSDLDSFTLYFTSLYRPLLLPGCMWGILHYCKWLW